MKKIIIPILSLITVSTFASLDPKREPIYKCVHYDESKFVDSLTIYQSRHGRGDIFHEVQVHVVKYGVESSYFKKVNLISKYGGKIQEFTTGNFRVKIDRVRKDADKHFATFARIPKYKIHSRDWSCKDY